MSTFNRRTVAMMRRVTARLFKDTCVLKRPQNNLNVYGYTPNDYVTIVKALPCRILPIADRNRDAMVGESEMSKNFFKLICPYDTDLRDNDRIEFDGAIYEIQQIEDAHTDRTDKRARIARLGDG